MLQLDLWLDHYDDIYSDFDSRNYLKRRISEDFIYELRMAFATKEGNISSLVLQLPSEERRVEEEHMIIKNLSGFFGSQFRSTQELFRKKKLTSLLLMGTGVMVMIANVLVSYYYSPLTFGLQALKVLLEPAGWFLLWSSMDYMFYGLKKLKADRDFFKEIMMVKWSFKSIGSQE